MLDLEAIKAFQLARMDDLLAAHQLALTAFETGRVPELSAVPQNVVYTAAAAGLAAQFVFLLLVARPFRRLVLATVDTALAIVLIAFLLVLVLGLPFGIVYIATQGSYHMASSLLHTFPPLKGAANLLRGALGLQQLL